MTLRGTLVGSGLAVTLLAPTHAVASDPAERFTGVTARATPDGGELERQAGKKRAKKTRVNVRLAPAAVTVGEPSVVSLQVSPRKRRVVRVQVREGGRWRTLAKQRTSRSGSANMRVAPDSSREYRVKVKRTKRLRGATSKPRRLSVLSPGACAQKRTVDPNRTPEAACVVARIDRWRSSGLMALGQQINAGSEDFRKPLAKLGSRKMPVIGFDLEELDQSEYEYPFTDTVLADLLDRAAKGSILVASWHAPNPRGLVNDPSTASAYDRSWLDLGALLDDSTAESQAFWADYAVKLDLFRRLQIGDADGDGVSERPGAAVVFRPFHEMNGDWFWWAQRDPATYRKVFDKLQRVTWLAGVHNVVWAFSYNYTTYASAPGKYLPAKIDIGGFNSYDPEPGAYPGNRKSARYHRKDRLDLNGYRDISKRVPRMAITETGPHGSRDGKWNPATVEQRVRAAGVTPAWAMFWYDDYQAGKRYTGRKEITSLQNGWTWLKSCPLLLCHVR